MRGLLLLTSGRNVMAVNIKHLTRVFQQQCEGIDEAARSS